MAIGFQDTAVFAPVVINIAPAARINMDGRLNAIEGGQLLRAHFHASAMRLLNDIEKYDIVLTVNQARQLFDVLMSLGRFDTSHSTPVDLCVEHAPLVNDNDPTLRYLRDTKIRFQIDY